MYVMHSTCKWNLKNKLVNTTKTNRLIGIQNKLVFTMGRGMAEGARWGTKRYKLLYTK